MLAAAVLVMRLVVLVKMVVVFVYVVVVLVLVEVGGMGVGGGEGGGTRGGRWRKQSVMRGNQPINATSFCRTPHISTLSGTPINAGGSY